MSSLVSMPSTSFYPFLLTVAGRNSAGKSCQCPQRASTYFYKDGKHMELKRMMVSMPSTGFYLFLLPAYNHKAKAKECQCPQRASTYFYEEKIMSKWIYKKCVNALNGLLLISTDVQKYQELKITCVNALNGLLLISTWRKQTKPQKAQQSVNALNGLLLISTK